MNHHINITRVKAVYNALDELKDKVVFVGGATVSLYADRMAAEIRETSDVDILIELYKRKDYIELEEQLRKKGFESDSSAKFVGRFKIQGIVVDVMPTIEEVLGFSNRWYIDGYSNAIDYTIDEQCTVKIFTGPYFIASKIEAFKGRGKRGDGELDGRFSQDFEDIVFVLENRRAIWEEMKSAKPELRDYLLNEFKSLYKNPYIEEWISSHSSSYSPPSVYFIMENIEEFIGFNS
ncbi:MAG: hypothetical protein HYR66_12070 [Sphingobacteriales bacterium]|nr:hypothetical protein [Sphingobacteriales bacterium]MBI3717156.1 hypothetical protein [Sphingobacteriales bacterium]